MKNLLNASDPLTAASCVKKVGAGSCNSPTNGCKYPAVKWVSLLKSIKDSHLEFSWYYVC